MLIQTVDLYAHFGIKKREGAKGILTGYLHAVTGDYPAAYDPRAAMVVIAGGAYSFVSDREKEPVAITYLQKGFQAFTLEYSTAPVTFPAQLIEGAMAIAYIRENAKDLGVCPNQIFALGFSAGGHLTGMLATMFDAREVKNALGIHARDCRPDGVLLSYAVVSAVDSPHKGSFQNLTGGNEALFERFSIEKNITAESSPAFIWCTATDNAVPAKNSFLAAEAYAAAGVPYEFHVFSDGPHGMSLSTKETVPQKHTQNAETVYENPHVAKWVDLSVEWIDSLIQKQSSPV